MTTHAPPSHCRSCPCPEWDAAADADADALAPGPGGRASLAGQCETCEHALGFHLSKFVWGMEEVRERKARGEESLEHCKVVAGGEECACACYEGGAGGSDCGVCGHKKGWHKAKLVVSRL